MWSSAEAEPTSAAQGTSAAEVVLSSCSRGEGGFDLGRGGMWIDRSGAVALLPLLRMLKLSLLEQSDPADDLEPVPRFESEPFRLDSRDEDEVVVRSGGRTGADSGCDPAPSAWGVEENEADFEKNCKAVGVLRSDMLKSGIISLSSSSSSGWLSCALAAGPLPK